jgi:hypothetical protein
MKIIKGNFFDYVSEDKNIIVPHVCNNVQKFGAGFAKSIALKWPIVRSKFLDFNAILGEVQFVDVDKLTVANMIAQDGVKSIKDKKPLRYTHLIKCMNTVGAFAKKSNAEIHTIKFGSNLAGGTWEFIEELIYELWDELPVFVYDNQ